ncbi:helix-turn-helix transcriptional regulator [Larkinella knui]|uniref:Helix-turn-helix domain-containing protein n=1 Tax=Larkinella knui TaxID=2025310 RepID=A0A3P1CHQ1_9BACT|nr:helix-turn-helix domain-containing protein [Larkinella knui]RRB12799.1 helix-turn-helix domain-containing protein [Larkinella knui]
MQILIKNKLNESELFRIKRMKEVIKTTHPHGHKDYLEIIYLQAGAGTHQIDFNRFPVKPHSLYLVMPGQIHSWELTEIPKGYVVMVQKDFLLDHPFYEALFQTFPLAFPSGFELAHIHQTILDLFRNMETEYEQRNRNYQAIIQTYIQLLLNLLKREVKSDDRPVLPGLLKDFFSLVDAQFKTNHEVGDYARQLNTTAKTLNTTCRKTVDRTAGEIISERLTTESKKMLLYSFQNLKEIAYELGFADPSHFNKFFKRQTGVLPSVYRKGIS